MIIIGEKINGAIPSVGKAIEERNEEWIIDLVKKQEEAGADYLDVCAGTSPELEREALVWLLEIVQSQTDLPICLDSPDPEVLKELMPLVRRPGIINSVSGEGNKCEVIYPLLQGNDWQVIALTCDEDGIPADASTKVEIALKLIEKAEKYGISPNRIHIDPLVLSLSTINQAMLDFNKAIGMIKEVYPQVKVTAALSNISYGLPARKLINQNFLALAMAAGLDSVIVDPLNRDIQGTILAVEALLGRDRLCRKYIKAYRAGRIGNRKI